MTEIYHAIEAILAKYPTQNIVVGYSGGVDSHVLLHGLSQCIADSQRHRLSAIHINHGLSEYAEAWQSHCQKIAEQLTISLTSIKVDLSQRKGESIESYARDARYHALVEHTDTNSVILLGQHSDDQLETFLLQLKRGAGPKGLSAMSADRLNRGRRFSRPLLNVSRVEIEAYANRYQLNWIEDESNQDINFDRNFLRHQVIPLLTQRWPSIATTTARSAALCAEQQQLIEDVAQQHLVLCLSNKGSLAINALVALDTRWQKQVIRQWIGSYNIKMPSEKTLHSLFTDVIHCRDDGVPHYMLNQHVIKRYNGELFLLHSSELAAQQTRLVDSQKPVSWNSKYVIEFHSSRKASCDLTIPRSAFDPNSVIEIKNFPFSSKFKPKGKTQHKPLTQWFKQWKIPPWQRSQIPQLWVNGQLVALLGVAVADQWPLIAEDLSPVYVHLVEVNVSAIKRS